MSTMKICYKIPLFPILLLPLLGLSQDFRQYFDGADTNYVQGSYPSSLRIQFMGDSTNIWQIGQPQKKVFNRAATFPKAIVTDTLNHYPPNDTSIFQYAIVPWVNYGILAFQWKQKLDMDVGGDGGIVEFSVDGGNSWDNAFNNSHVYAFYGYDVSNVDTLPGGYKAFTGSDTTWKDIWLCYDMSWLSNMDSIIIRHTFVSDSVGNSKVENKKEGWMIDNLLGHVTVTHTINEVEQEEYMLVSPNPTKGKIDIQTRKLNEFHIIEKIELLTMEGKLVQEWGISPTQFYIDISHHPEGIYLLNVKTNKSMESFKIVLEK